MIYCPAPQCIINHFDRQHNIVTSCSLIIRKPVTSRLVHSIMCRSIYKWEMKQVCTAECSAAVFNRCSCSELHCGQQGMTLFRCVRVLQLLACETPLLDSLAIWNPKINTVTKFRKEKHNYKLLLEGTRKKQSSLCRRCALCSAGCKRWLCSTSHIHHRMSVAQAGESKRAAPPPPPLLYCGFSLGRQLCTATAHTASCLFPLDEHTRYLRFSRCQPSALVCVASLQWESYHALLEIKVPKWLLARIRCYRS